MLMFDRITEISETGGAFDKGFIRAEFDIKPDLWFFACHFIGNPVMPGCLGLDAHVADDRLLSSAGSASRARAWRCRPAR